MSEMGGRDTDYAVYLRGRVADYFAIASFFTLTDFAAYAGLNLTVNMRRRINQLVESGYLEVDYRANPQGRGACKVYRLAGDLPF